MLQDSHHGHEQVALPEISVKNFTCSDSNPFGNPVNATIHIGLQHILKKKWMTKSFSPTKKLVNSSELPLDLIGYSSRVIAPSYEKSYRPDVVQVKYPVDIKLE